MNALVDRAGGGRALALDTLLALTVRVLGAGAGFLMSLVIARTLGAGEAGYFLLAFSIVTFLAAVSRLGLDNVVLRYTGAAAPDRDMRTVRLVLGRCLLLAGVVSASVAALLACLAGPLAEWVFDKPALAPVLRAIAPGLAGLALFTLVAMSLQGLRRVIASVATLNILCSLFLVAGLLLFALADASQAAWTYSASAALTLVAGLHLWARATRHQGRIHDPVSWRQLLEPALPLWIVLVLGQAIQWAGQFIAGAYVSPEQLAQLAVAQRTAMLTSFVLTAVNLVVAPRFAAMHKKGDIDAMRRVALTSVRLMLLAATPMVAVMLLLPDRLMWLFGNEFVEGAHLLQILAIGQFINVATGSVGFLLSMTGHEKDLRNNLLLVAPCSVLLSFLVIPVYGATGAAVATAVAVAAQNLMAVYWVRKRLGFNTLAIWRR
ncbi:oligosaccharide flippase family protein [Marinobacterium aestuariivivens]|uniref:Oligosaccharide flippase family protein n=1 Tax=Marinobacterium aestuariivivens TaxID=1698799 RepID=A0ABW1ZZD7_9GAMM